MNTQTQQLSKTLSFGKIAYTSDKAVNLVEVDIELRLYRRKTSNETDRRKG